MDINDNKNKNGKDPNKKKNPRGIISMIILAMIACYIVGLFYTKKSSVTTEELTYYQFLELVEKGEVKEAEIDSTKISFKLKEDAEFEGEVAKQYREAFAEIKKNPLMGAFTAGDEAIDSMIDNIKYYVVRVSDQDLNEYLYDNGVDFKGVTQSTAVAIIYNILSFVLPVLLIWGILGLVMRKMGGGMGGLGVGKSNAKVYVEKETGVTFADVAGQDEAKESLVEVVDFLNNPKKYTKIGAKLPKGALLVGPPGTGKTLLAKAVAGEAGVPFFSLAGSDFVEMFVGVGASRVRDLFKEANKQAPCIIFIDEIDAVGKSRDSRYGGGNDEREQTLNALLAEMDGFDTSKGLLLLAATNRPEVLDKALLRPGRFDRRIIVDRPDMQGRLDTLKVHAKDVKLDETVDLEAIALATAGLVGSDLANIINEAAIIAVKNDRELVCQADLFEAFELVAVGGKEKKNKAMSDKERKIVSYHEVGHALASALQKNTEPVQKITIVPRTMGALGYTLQTPEEEKFLETKDELLAKIVTYMAGRAAEELVFESPTSGAANDIEMATKIAKSMVTRFGMSEKFGMMGLATVEHQYLEGYSTMDCGDETSAAVDKEVLAIINSCYEKAMNYLTEYREALDKISDYLYEKETITGKEFMEQFREITGIEPEPEEEKKDDSEGEDTTEDGADDSETGTVIDVTVDDNTESFNETETSSDVNPENDFREV